MARWPRNLSSLLDLLGKLGDLLGPGSSSRRKSPPRGQLRVIDRPKGANPNRADPPPLAEAVTTMHEARRIQDQQTANLEMLASVVTGLRRSLDAVTKEVRDIQTRLKKLERVRPRR